MLVPSVFRNNFMDDFFDDMFSAPIGFSRFSEAMSTDVKDLGDAYELDIELPGFEKKDIHVELNKGYLRVVAEREDNKEEKDEKGKYVRKERYSGRCERSFFVGNELHEEDIKAGFENGILKLDVPKKEISKQVEQKSYIPIE